VISNLSRVRVPDTLTWGIALAVVTALISGVSIFVNAFAVKQLPDPAVYTTLKNGVAALLLLGLAAAAVRPADVRAINRASWAKLLVIGVIGGSVPFILFFTGLAQASAPSAAFIHKTLFVWVALLAVPFLGERLGLLQLGALGVLLAGQALVIKPAGIVWGTGEAMIAAATLLWAVESILARRVLGSVPSPVVGAARLGFGLIVLVAYLAVAGKLGSIAALSAGQWLWAMGTGLLLSGYVASWFAALKRAPASVVTSILVLGAPITAGLQAIQAGAVPTPVVVAGELLIVAAVLGLITWSGRRSSPAAATA
jgi:drug/metabolite transporter (DMT)-like permease